MQTYLDGQALSLPIPLVDEVGECITVSAVEYRIADHSNVELVARLSLSSFTSGDAQAIITIAGSVNTLQEGGSRRALRIIELFLTTSSGVVRITHEYIVEAAEVLELGINSFQSYYESVLLSLDITDIKSYEFAAKSDRISAMISAWRNIGKLYLRYLDDQRYLAENDMERLVLPVAETGDITLLDAYRFNNLPVEMRAAILRAQIIEADYLLGGDPLGNLRRQGVIATITGESSQYFSQKTPYQGPVCKRAMKELGRYIVHSYRLGRS